jgi:hypothetical protein
MAYRRGMAVKQTASRGAAVSRTQSYPSPIGGLNAVDAIAAMPPTDALVMENWFPQPSFVSLRNGYSMHATGFPAWVESVFCYSSAAGEEIFGVSGTAVYDGTTAGPIGAAVVTGLTNARWEYVNTATAGGQFLYAANGVDKPLLYNGTAWVKVDNASTPAITGVTTTTLRNPAVWKNRVWFVQDATMKAWYLPTASVGGAAQSFDLGPIFDKGGELQAILTASLTDGSTFDNYIGFLTTNGQLAIYNGTDPATAGLFNIVGVYDIGKPVGRRCFFRMGSDCIIICADGFVSLQKLISIGKFNAEKTTISYKILNLVNAAVQNYKNNFGWQGVLHPLGNKVLVNVPQNENLLQYQFAMNTISSAWCTFTNWNFATLEVQGDVLYGGGATYIAIADSTQADNGSAINATLKTAFSYFGTDKQKFFKMVRPLLETNGTINPSLAINVDFQDMPPIGVGTYIGTLGSAWDISPWDTTPWAPGNFVQTDWKTVYGVGFSAALYIKVQSANVTVNLQALDYTFGLGGVL